MFWGRSWVIDLVQFDLELGYKAGTHVISPFLWLMFVVNVFYVNDLVNTCYQAFKEHVCLSQSIIQSGVVFISSTEFSVLDS